jgi:hypothetical protein
LQKATERCSKLARLCSFISYGLCKNLVEIVIRAPVIIVPFPQIQDLLQKRLLHLLEGTNAPLDSRNATL